MKVKILLSLLFTAIILLGRLKEASGSTILFSDDFNDNVLSNQFQVKNYTLEDSGSFGPFSDLALVETGGEIKISGSGSIDTATVDGQVVGWIGRSLILDQQIPLNSQFAIESQVKIVQGTSGFVTHLTIEFDADNRITSSLGDTTTNGQRLAHLSFDEFNTGRCVGCQTIPYPFANNQTLTMRLEFDPASGNTKFFIDGNLIVEHTYQGALVNPRVGLAATVRLPGSTIDARFDNLVVETFSSNTLPVPDLKQFSPPWNDDEYDTATLWSSNPTIERWGCAMTSASMVLNYYNHFIDPGDLNSWMKNNGGYLRNGSVWWPSIAKYSEVNSDQNSPILEFSSSQYNEATLDNELSADRPVITRLPSPMHFVVIKGKSGSDYLINDPGAENFTNLSQSASNHSSPDSLRIFRPTNSDLSYIGLVIEPDFSITVYDPEGNEIQGFQYIENPLTDNISNVPLNSKSLRIFQYPKPNNGIYRVVISGGPGSYQLDTYIHDKDGNLNFVEQVGNLEGGKADEYLIYLNKDSSENSNISVVSFDSILEDLKTAYKNHKIKRRSVYRIFRRLVTSAKRYHVRGRISTAERMLSLINRYLSLFTPRFINPDTSSLLQTKIDILRHSL